MGDRIALAQGMWLGTRGVLTKDEVVSRFGSVTPAGNAVLTFAAAGTTVVLVGVGTLDGLGDHIILL